MATREINVKLSCSDISSISWSLINVVDRPTAPSTGEFEKWKAEEELAIRLAKTFDQRCDHREYSPWHGLADYITDHIQSRKKGEPTR